MKIWEFYDFTMSQEEELTGRPLTEKEKKNWFNYYQEIALMEVWNDKELDDTINSYGGGMILSLVPKGQILFKVHLNRSFTANKELALYYSITKIVASPNFNTLRFHSKSGYGSLKNVGQYFFNTEKDAKSFIQYLKIKFDPLKYKVIEK